MLFGFGCISVSAGVADYGSALTAGHFFKRQKVTKRLRPDVRPARWGSGFLRCGIDPGAAAPVCFAAPPSAVYDCVVRSLRSHPRINPSTQPADGLQDQKLLELALIVLSDEKRWGLLLLLLFCESEPAREGGLPADLFLSGTRSSCRSCRRLRSFDLAFAFAFPLRASLHWTLGVDQFMSTPQKTVGVGLPAKAA